SLIFLNNTAKIDKDRSKYNNCNIGNNLNRNQLASLMYLFTYHPTVSASASLPLSHTSARYSSQSRHFDVYLYDPPWNFKCSLNSFIKLEIQL
ncbi:MAG TPA: hypothetical protein VF220_09410, partial [Nitrososphaeraceae archaeon]